MTHNTSSVIPRKESPQKISSEGTRPSYTFPYYHGVDYRFPGADSIKAFAIDEGTDPFNQFSFNFFLIYHPYHNEAALLQLRPREEKGDEYGVHVLMIRRLRPIKVLPTRGILPKRPAC